MEGFKYERSSNCRSSKNSNRKFWRNIIKISAVELGTIAAKEAIKRAGIKPEIVEEVIYWKRFISRTWTKCCKTSINTCRYSEEASALTINKVCGSGLRAVSMAAQFIMTGDAEVVLAGGTESMSNAPYILPNNRWGQRMGDGNVVDTMIKDGSMGCI